MPVTTPSGHRYVLTLIDDYSRYTEIRLLKSKDEVFDVIKNYVARMNTRFGRKPIIFRSDNGLSGESLRGCILVNLTINFVENVFITMHYQATSAQSRRLVTCCMQLGRFKWYNIRKPSTNSQQADPEYFEKQALALQPLPGYTDKLVDIWLEMVSVSRDVTFKRDDFFIQRNVKQWLPELDIEKTRAEYEYIAALKNAPNLVKRIFTVQYGQRKDSTFLWKRALVNLVRQHDLDNESLESRIARHTALIRHWTALLVEMKSVSYFTQVDIRYVA
ncbi:hypothetical protein D918_05165 [Trichuris suis]|nr:hypothetical protein D918_05165 [Trichuris suis]